MKRYRIEYTLRWSPAPMSFWVHVEQRPRRRSQARIYDPPLPFPVPGKGYARFFIEVDGLTFEFASFRELDVCIRTLSQRHLPSTERETETRRTGPGKHWLNRLPAGTHSWTYRQKAVKALREARKAFATELAVLVPAKTDACAQ